MLPGCSTAPRVSLFISVTAVLIIAIVGTVVGIIAGYKTGWIDTIIGRSTDLLLAFPFLLMLIALSPVLTQRLEALGLSAEDARIAYLIIVFAFFGWPYLARLIRGQVLSLREREFVEAAVANGRPTRRILFKEILPNLWAPDHRLRDDLAADADRGRGSAGLPRRRRHGADAVLGQDARRLGARTSPSCRRTCSSPARRCSSSSYAFNVFGDAVRDALDPRTGRNLR